MNDDNSIYSAPKADLSTPADNTPLKIERIIKNPFSATNLRDLLFFPKRFFAATVAIEAKLATFFIVWLSGIIYALDRMDLKISNAYIKTGSIEDYAYLTASWPYYIGTAIGSGLLSAAFAWLIFGWWYKTRVRFCGVSAPDPTVSREILFYSGLPYIIASLLVLAVSVIRFDNYAAEFYSAGDIYSLPLYLLPLLTLIWSIIISFIGVKAKFRLQGFAPILWFLILPLLFYIGIFALYFFFSL